MYHRPRMCRTCLQMSRGDFKFVSLDSVDPLWESNSPNLKEQLIYLIPEMRIDNTGAHICTSCFIALRTAYEFKKMCQATEKKFQNHNYKYRRPYGVGPGSSQFHVTLNENGNYQEIANFHCQNLNYLQTDTSIDITEHHLFDASKAAPPRKQVGTSNNVPQKRPEVDADVTNEKPAEKVTNSEEKVKNGEEKVKNGEEKVKNSEEKVKNKEEKIETEAQETKASSDKTLKKEDVPDNNTDKQPNEIPSKKLDSTQLRKKYNIGSQISILKTQPRIVTSIQSVIKMACEEVPYLKLNGIGPDALRCYVQIQILTQDLVKTNTCGKYNFEELQEVAKSYYTEEDLLTCKICSRCFSTRYWLQIHEEQHSSEKPFTCSHCNMQFIRSDSLEEHLKIHNKLLLLTPQLSDGTTPSIAKPPDPKITETTDNIKQENPESSVNDTIAKSEKEDLKNETKPENSTETNGTTKVEDLKTEASVEMAVCTPVLNSEQNDDSIENKSIKNESNDENIKTPSVDTLNSSSSPEIAKQDDKDDKIKVKQVVSPTESNIRGTKKQHFKMVRYCKCLICNKTFRGEVHLYQHCKFIHVPKISSDYWSNIIFAMRPKQKPDTPTNLEKEETKEEPLLIERRRVTYQSATPYKCMICGKGFSEENFLNLHMYVHTPTILSPDNVFTANYESPEVYTCYLCNKGFAKERYLKLHNLHVHLSKTTICKICNREFKSEFWFSRHRCQQPVEVPIIDEKKSFQCNFCNRRFARLRFMKSHRKRMHKNLIRNPIKIRPKYLPNKANKEPFEIDNLELDVDPMKLYKISGTSSFDDDEDVIEILSDSDEYSDESSNDSEDEDDEHSDPLMYNKGDIQRSTVEYKKTLEPFNPPLITRQEFNEKEELNFNHSSEITIRRKSIVRSSPKLQCDFCGEFIDESAYDNHIFEHNNMRLQKSLNARKSENNYNFESLQDNTVDNNKIVLKCHICFKAFKRKFYLISHINRHLNNEDTQQTEGDEIHSEGEETDDSETDTHSKESETDDQVYGRVSIVNGTEIYICCERTFKLKAHFVRHYKIKHARSHKPKRRYAMEQEMQSVDGIEKEKDCEEFEDSVSNRTRYVTRNSLSAQDKTMSGIKEEEEDGEVDEDSVANKSSSRVAMSLISNTANKRKIINQLANEEIPIKKQKIIKRELSEGEETLTRKRIKTDMDDGSSRPPTLTDEDFLPVSSKPLKYECNVCEKRFKQKCQLRDHFNVHTGDKPYKCEFCKPVRGFTQTSSLYVHFRRVHAVIMKNCLWEVYSKNGECLVCGTIFEKHAHMFKHMKDNYSEKQHQCHICLKKFNMICHYNIHNIGVQEMQKILIKEKIEVMVKSEEIEEEEEEEEELAEHDEQTEESPFIEGACDSDTASSGNDDKLSGKEDNKITKVEHLKCTKCDKEFTDKQQLRFHKKSLAHFQQVQSLKKQLNTKNEDGTNTNPITLSNADTIEDIQNNVDAIIKKIRTIKRHKCPKCDLSFIRKIQLKKHKKKCHRFRNVNMNSMKVVSNTENNSATDADSSGNIVETDVKATDVKSEVPETTADDKEPVATSSTCINPEPSASNVEQKECNSENNLEESVNTEQQISVEDVESSAVLNKELQEEKNDTECNPTSPKTQIETTDSVLDDKSEAQVTNSECDSSEKLLEASSSLTAINDDSKNCDVNESQNKSCSNEGLPEINHAPSKNDEHSESQETERSTNSGTCANDTSSKIDDISNSASPTAAEFPPEGTPEFVKDVVETQPPIVGDNCNSECPKESLEKEPTSTCSSDLNVECVQNLCSVEKVNTIDSNSVGLNEESVNIEPEPEALLNNQDLDDSKTASEAEPVNTELVSSADNNMECSKGISKDDAFLESNNMDAVDNFDLESLKTVSECVELNK